MLTRWTVKESPTRQDPKRRLLLLKGSASDVQGVIRKLGAVCSRPKKDRGNPDFNFRLFLHGVTEEDLPGIEAELKTMAAGPLRTPPSPGPMGPPGAEGERAAPAAEPEAPTPPPVPAPEQKKEPAAASDRKDTEPLGLTLEGPGGEPAPVQPPAAKDEKAAEPPAEEPTAPLKLRKADEPPPVPAEPPSVPAAAASRPVPSPAPALAEAEQQLFGARRALDRAFTMDSLIVGAANRFAHAGATSVLSSPGTMYNPLFIFGGAGLGKTHFLHAIGHKLQELPPEDAPVFLTSGPLLARAAALAGASGKQAELEEFAAQAKALLIDDIQLMGVAEQNQALLTKLFKLFFEPNKQVVMTSAYPHRLLGALEQALGFKIAAGQAVELKKPAEKVRKGMAEQLVKRSGLPVDEVGLSQFTERALADFPTLSVGVRRMLSMRNVRSGGGQSSLIKDLLSVVYAPDTNPPMPMSEDEVKSALGSASPLPAEGPMQTALFFPNLQDMHADWIWVHLHDTAKKNGWPTPFRMAVRKAYSLDQVFATPFIVAEECYQAGVRAALVLGPPPGSDLSEHEGEFRYVAEHLLRDSGIAMGWVQFNRVKDPKYAALAYLDLMAGQAPSPAGGGKG